MAHWLFKSEPSAWSYEKVAKCSESGTDWSGVRNHSAKRNMQAMKVGEEGFFYHSNEGLAAAQTRPATAIVITDGYIERLCPSLVEKVAGVRLHALVTRDGSPAELRRAGIPYTQLEKVPS